MSSLSNKTQRNVIYYDAYLWLYRVSVKLKTKHGKVFGPKEEYVKWNAAQEVCFVSEATHRDVRKGRNGEYVRKGTIGNHRGLFS